MSAAARDSERSIVASYERAFVPPAFDLLIAAVFAPLGGVRRLREQALDRLELRPGLRVLELGCGTGGITRLLLERGVEVTAIDGSAHMLARALGRAPKAHFAQQQLEALALPDGAFDRVLFAFVLHELPRALRARALSSALRSLAPDGRLAVLDHAVPSAGRFATGWRRFLLALEPPSVADCIADGFDAELEAADARVLARHELARGTARLSIARSA